MIMSKFRTTLTHTCIPLIKSEAFLSIIDLAELIKDSVRFDGDFKLNSSKPNGTLRKVLNVEKINKLGWSSKISLKEGITQTYQDYCHERVTKNKMLVN